MDTPETPNGEALRQLVSQIAEVRMPFGKYGPAQFPPKGCPIMDIPVEYLTWFKERGFPKGKLGYLMEQCWLLRANGLDGLFDPFRSQNGGRATRKKKPRIYEFGDE